MNNTKKYIETIFENITESLYCKNKKGIYLEVNDVFINTSATGAETDILGKTDQDLIWGEFAPTLMKNDQEVIYTNLPKTTIERVTAFGTTPSWFISRKAPFRSNSGKIIGVIGLSLLLEEENSPLLLLNCTNSTNNSTKISKLDNFTQRQSDCLYYLVEGMTLKKIGNTLGISPRTVEHHLDMIKRKLKCYTKSQLIDKALEMEFIKKRLFNRGKGSNK